MGNAPRAEERPPVEVQEDDPMIIDVGQGDSAGPQYDATPSVQTPTLPPQNQQQQQNNSHLHGTIYVCADVPFTLSAPLLAQLTAPQLQRDISHILNYQRPDLKQYNYEFTLEKSIVRDCEK